MRENLAKIGCLLVILVFIGATVAVMGEQVPQSSGFRVPMVQDWSSHHMVFSTPRSLSQNLKLQQDPRYFQQYLSRNVGFRGPIARPIHDPVSILRVGSEGLSRDWGISVGSGFTTGDGNFPAKYSYNINATPSCSGDFVVFTSTNENFGGGNVTIYAANNLYFSTTGTPLCSSGPTVLWAYTFYTNFGGEVVGSPVLSLDGSQVAWMESGGFGGTGTLHILRPYTGGGAGTLAAPDTLANSSSAATYRACTPTAGSHSGTNQGGCLYSISFADGHNDTTSSPYYDYSDDAIFVGDASGDLHLITGIFGTVDTLTEVTTGGWPIAVHAGDPLTSAVYDTNSLNAFVGDSGGRVSYVTLGGSVSGGTATATLGGAVWNIGTSVSNDGPLVDGTTGEVFIFAKSAAGALVGEATTSLGTQTGPVNVGSSTTSTFHSGMFDNLYYSTDTGAGSGTGNLYVCGNSGATNEPTIFQIPVSSGVISTTTKTNEYTAASASQECSPVTEFYNSNASGGAGVDYIFFSVHGNGEPVGASGCGGTNDLACVYAATVTSGTFTAPGGTGTGALAVSGGTSGIVVDNNGTGIGSDTGASSIYYTWLSNGTTGANNRPQCNGTAITDVCAVKVTQSGLN